MRTVLAFPAGGAANYKRISASFTATNHLVIGIGRFQARRIARRRDTTGRIRRRSRRRWPLGAARRYEACVKFFTQTLHEAVISWISQ